MYHYESTVTKMMSLLREKDFCSSSIASHRDCYQGFLAFMEQKALTWTKPVVNQWLNSVRAEKGRQCFFVWQQYMHQLQEMFDTGSVTDKHLTLNHNSYLKLDYELRKELDFYLDFCQSRYTEKSLELAKVHCAKILTYFEERGFLHVDDITYADIISFYNSYFPCSQKNTSCLL